MKTSELKAAALDWAVAKAEGKKPSIERNLIWTRGKNTPYALFQPSIDWAIGGPIIERELIEIYPIGVLACNVEWCARKVDTDGDLMYLYGDTPLISAMRCYVASKMGNDIDIPKELNHANG